MHLNWSSPHKQSAFGLTRSRTYTFSWLFWIVFMILYVWCLHSTLGTRNAPTLLLEKRGILKSQKSWWKAFEIKWIETVPDIWHTDGVHCYGWDAQHNWGPESPLTHATMQDSAYNCTMAASKDQRMIFCRSRTPLRGGVSEPNRTDHAMMGTHPPRTQTHATSNEKEKETVTTTALSSWRGWKFGVFCYAGL